MTGPGTQAPQRDIGPLTRQMFVRYSGASGDLNPMHYDDEFARSAGHPSVFAQGMFSAGVDVPALLQRDRAGVAEFWDAFFAMCGAVCGIQLDGQRVSRMTLALFGVDSVPMRARATESALIGAAVDDLDLPDIGRAVAATLDPPGDLHASAAQRRKMAKALVPRVLATAINEAKHA